MAIRVARYAILNFNRNYFLLAGEKNLSLLQNMMFKI